MRVRPALTSEVPIICHLVRKLAEYEGLANEVHFDEHQYSQHLFVDPPNPKPEVILAETDEGNVVGLALFVQISKDAIHLEDLFIDESARGQGGGIALLSQLATIAINRGAVELQWNCLDWNEPSIKFYRSIGAIPVPDIMVFRITGSALVNKAVNPSTVDETLNNDLIQHDNSFEDESKDYTLSFTTFLATPVVYLPKLEITESSPEKLHFLIEKLIGIAIAKAYSRVDICLSLPTQRAVGELLQAKYGAVEMTGWTGWRLRGQSLVHLAARSDKNKVNKE